MGRNSYLGGSSIINVGGSTCGAYSQSRRSSVTKLIAVKGKKQRKPNKNKILMASPSDSTQPKQNTSTFRDKISAESKRAKQKELRKERSKLRNEKETKNSESSFRIIDPKRIALTEAAKELANSITTEFREKLRTSLRRGQ